MKNIKTYSISMAMLSYLVVCAASIPYSKQIAIQNIPVIPISKVVDAREMNCLAENIFFEARGTDEQEMIRVINVTTNRVKKSGFYGY